MVMLDAIRFMETVRRLGGPWNSTDAFEALESAYSEAQRAYHNAAHIEDCLKQFDSARHLAERPDEVETAIWFHDVVYDPKFSDNEERSAFWAVETLKAGDVDRDVLRRIAALIMATKHDRDPASPDEALLIDVDLSILGRSPEEFAAFDAAIRREYSEVPEDQYRAGRANVLVGFLRRDAFYHTELFRERFEAPARRNLEQAIEKLRG
jgi:predicted metal-dependent HD superfamily phosphohydrolase